MAVTFSQPAKKSRRIHVGEALILHLLDVRARGERLFGAGQHQAVLRGVGVVGSEGVDQLLQHLAVERVQRLRAVERDERHGAALLDQDGVVVGHANVSGKGVHASRVGKRREEDVEHLVGDLLGRRRVPLRAHCPCRSAARARLRGSRGCERRGAASAYSARISSAKLSRVAPSASRRSETLQDSGLLVRERR